jgi:hypothetical protein
MISRLKHIVILGIAVFLSGIIVAQEYQEQGWIFLSGKGVEFPNSIHGKYFETERNIGKLIILESNQPACFVALKSRWGEYRIVAYSTENSFSGDPSGEALENDLIEQMEGVPFRSLLMSKNGSLGTIGPLLQTKWAQGAWFNRYCPIEPNGSKGHAWAGCVPVAMGQIIKSFGNNNEFDYNWARMLDEPIAYEPNVSKLLADLGELIHTNYGNQASTSSMGMALKGFHDLGYNQAYRVRQNEFSEEDWSELILDNLDNYSPILVAGGGHAFVCDGYDQNGFLHFNLGGAGYGDGFYSTAVVFGYTVQEAIVNIQPDNPVDPPEMVFLDSGESEPVIRWTKPHSEVQLSHFRVYYNEDEFFDSNDYALPVSELKPGYHAIKVSAIYPDGESIAVGPVWVFNKGEIVIIEDAAVLAAINTTLHRDTSLLLSSQSIYQGDLALIRELSISEAIGSSEIFQYFINIQGISLNALNLNSQDLEFLEECNSLQSFTLSNWNEGLFSEITLPDNLVTLKLESGNLDQSDFLDSIDHLFELKLHDVEVPEYVFKENKEDMTVLSLTDILISNLDFLSSCPNLFYLHLSGNQITELSVPQALSKVQVLIVENNNLSSTDFLSSFPNVSDISLRNNQISQLSLHTPLKQLRYLDAGNNSINKVTIAFDFPLIKKIQLDNNHLHEIPDFFSYLPVLEELILNNNEIRTLLKRASHSLKKLDVSSNKIVNLSSVVHYQRLQVLILSDNFISDYSPLLENDFYRQLKLLDIRNTPVSIQSYNTCIPEFGGGNRVFLSSQGYEPRSPCYPTPIHGSQLSNYEMNFTWSSEYTGEDVQYDFLLASGDSLLVVESGLTRPELKYKLDEQQFYNWQVRAVYADTVFYSGQYGLKTFESIPIPYNEGFELYRSSENITQASRFWRISEGRSDTFQDAVISGGHSQSGSQSLKIDNIADVTLDLSHVRQQVIRIGFSIYCDWSKAGYFCLENLEGMDIGVLIIGDRVTVYVNSEAIDNFQVDPQNWHQFMISVLGKSDRIFIRCDNKLVFNLQWHFRDNMAHLDGISFTSKPDRINDGSTNGEFYLDNIFIEGLGLSTVPDPEIIDQPLVHAYPNPAVSLVRFTDLPTDKGSGSIVLYNMSGQQLTEIVVDGTSSSIDLDVRAYSPGMYFYKINLLNYSGSAQSLLISH